VPSDFVVPANAQYPEAAWGYHVGQAVHAIMHHAAHARHRAELDALGAELHQDPGHVSWDRLKAALWAWKVTHGHLLVPADFVVPAAGSIEFPDAQTWGLKLGQLCAGIKAGGGLFHEHADELDEMGFPFKPTAKLTGWDRVKAAFEAHIRVYGHLKIRRDCVVPSTAEWPADCWGMKLGDTREAIKRGTSYKGKREELEAMGFEFDKKKASVGWPKMKAALEAYKHVHGDMNVPFTFVVPSTAEYPEDVWGVKLGWGCNTIKYQVAPIHPIGPLCPPPLKCDSPTRPRRAATRPTRRNSSPSASISLGKTNRSVRPLLVCKRLIVS
jgi:hypothetical protein